MTAQKSLLSDIAMDDLVSSLDDLLVETGAARPVRRPRSKLLKRMKPPSDTLPEDIKGIPGLHNHLPREVIYFHTRTTCSHCGSSWEAPTYSVCSTFVRWTWKHGNSYHDELLPLHSSAQHASLPHRMELKLTTTDHCADCFQTPHAPNQLCMELWEPGAFIPIPIAEESFYKGMLNAETSEAHPESYTQAHQARDHLASLSRGAEQTHECPRNDINVFFPAINERLGYPED